MGLRHSSALTTCLSHRRQVSLVDLGLGLKERSPNEQIKENGELFSIKDWNLFLFSSVERSKITLRWVELLWRAIFWTVIELRSSWDIVEGLKCCNLKAVFQLDSGGKHCLPQTICLYFRFDTWKKKIAVFLCYQCKCKNPPCFRLWLFPEDPSLDCLSWLLKSLLL